MSEIKFNTNAISASTSPLHPRTEILHTSNAILPYYLRIPEYMLQYSANETTMLPYFRDISDLIQTSVVPATNENDVQRCITYNPPDSFESGYSLYSSVSTHRLMSM